mmetsp:Transcript_50602/g.101048  ORF Transcript_50602/g.101048 Transcript_50602/m.101048 type:complete len:208 (-) Transcript_50602:636-1259(-)
MSRIVARSSTPPSRSVAFTLSMYSISCCRMYRAPTISSFALSAPLSLTSLENASAVTCWHLRAHTVPRCSTTKSSSLYPSSSRIAVRLWSRMNWSIFSVGIPLYTTLVTSSFISPAYSPFWTWAGKMILPVSGSAAAIASLMMLASMPSCRKTLDAYQSNCSRGHASWITQVYGSPIFCAVRTTGALMIVFANAAPNRPSSSSRLTM